MSVIIQGNSTKSIETPNAVTKILPFHDHATKATEELIFDVFKTITAPANKAPDLKLTNNIVPINKSELPVSSWQKIKNLANKYLVKKLWHEYLVDKLWLNKACDFAWLIKYSLLVIACALLMAHIGLFSAGLTTVLNECALAFGILNFIVGFTQLDQAIKNLKKAKNQNEKNWAMVGVAYSIRVILIGVFGMLACLSGMAAWANIALAITISSGAFFACGFVYKNCKKMKPFYDGFTFFKGYESTKISEILKDKLLITPQNYNKITEETAEETKDKTIDNLKSYIINKDNTLVDGDLNDLKKEQLRQLAIKISVKNALLKKHEEYLKFFGKDAFDESIKYLKLNANEITNDQTETLRKMMTSKMRLRIFAEACRGFSSPVCTGATFVLSPSFGIISPETVANLVYNAVTLISKVSTFWLNYPKWARNVPAEESIGVFSSKCFVAEITEAAKESQAAMKICGWFRLRKKCA